MPPITIPTADPEKTLVCLMQNVLYVALEDGNGQILGKIISVNRQKSYKPNNQTAALLLYLLVRDADEPILLKDFLDLAKARFSGTDDAKIKTFLDELDQTHKILKIRQGSSGTNSPDPLNFFGSAPTNWETPGLIEGNPPICRSNTFYSTGYRIFLIPR
jgi:hypothetical protein